MHGKSISTARSWIASSSSLLHSDSSKSLTLSMSFRRVFSNQSTWNMVSTFKGPRARVIGIALKVATRDVIEELPKPQQDTAALYSVRPQGGLAGTHCTHKSRRWSIEIYLCFRQIEMPGWSRHPPSRRRSLVSPRQASSSRITTLPQKAGTELNQQWRETSLPDDIDTTAWASMGTAGE